MAATRARTELAASAPQNVKDMTPSREPPAPAAVDAANSNDQTPARRTTTRTRKLPSRLLPSPSPPPSRPSSQYSATKQNKGGKDSSHSSTASPVTTPSASSATPVSKLRKASRSDVDTTSSDFDTAGEKDGNLSSEDLGPGKRKRRPSSMYKPPSTLTTVETPSPASAVSASKSKKKGRSTSPELSAQKTQSPSAAAAAQAKLKSRLSKGKSDVQTPLSKGSEMLRGDGDNSEAELESSNYPTASKRLRIGEAHDSMDLSPPPLLPRDGSVRVRMPTNFTQPTFIRGGRVSVSPDASAKRSVKFGIREFSRPALQADEASQIPRASNRTDAQHSWKHADIMSSSPISAGISKFDNDSNMPLTYIPFRCAARSAAGFRNMHTTPFALDEEDEEADDDDDDDENDFHQAMLDADFDFFDSQKSDSNVGKPVWSASRRATTEDAEMDDTPATTPRSPQSGCDLPSPGSPRFKTEDDVALHKTENKTSSFGAGRDSVFVHALPTTQVGADKPHQHAGSLTLSLPYSPAVGVSSPQLRAMDIDNDAASAAVRGGAKTATANNNQMGTPVLQRRKHAGLPAGPHGLAPLKLGSDLMEQSASNSAPYMQLSPMIEIESPLLSPGLSLSLHTKGTDLPSPFIMGVGTLPDLEQPAPLDLPPAEGSTTPKTSSPEVMLPAAPKLDLTQSATVKDTTTSTQLEKKTAAAEPIKEAAKVDKPSTRRPALPPPRQIRFTTFTTPSLEPSDSKPQQQSQPEPAKTTTTVPPVPIPQQQTSQHQRTSTGASSISSKSDSTPDLVHSGSSSPDSASDSPSPMSQADSTASGDAEAENILFGPPEKLDLHELDHAWGGNKAAQHEAVMRRAKVTQIHHVNLNVAQ